MILVGAATMAGCMPLLLLCMNINLAQYADLAGLT